MAKDKDKDFVKPWDMSWVDKPIDPKQAALWQKYGAVKPLALLPMPQLEQLAPRRRKTIADLSALFRSLAGIKTTPQGLP